MAKEKEIIKSGSIILPEADGERQDLFLKVGKGADAPETLQTKYKYVPATGSDSYRFVAENGHELEGEHLDKVLERGYKGISGTSDMAEHEYERLMRLTGDIKGRYTQGFAAEPVQKFIDAHEVFEAHQAALGKIEGTTVEEGRKTITALRIKHGSKATELEEALPSSYKTALRRSFAAEGEDAYKEWNASSKRLQTLATKMKTLSDKFGKEEKFDDVKKQKQAIHEALKGYWDKEKGFGDLANEWPENAGNHLFKNSLGYESMAQAMEGFTKDGKAVFDELETLANRAAAQQTIINANQGTFGSKSKVDAANKAMQSIKEDLAELKVNNPHLVEVAELDLPADKLRALKATGLSSNLTRGGSGVGTALESDAKDVAKKSGNGLFGIFKHNEDSLEALAKKQGKTVDELSQKIGDMRGNRVAVGIAAGVGLTAVAMSMFGGKKEDKSFAGREDERRTAIGAGMAKA